MDQTDTAVDKDKNNIALWISENLQGTITRFETLPRWRPSWNVDVILDKQREPLRLHVRGERGEGMETQPLKFEMGILQVLAKHGIPVPHIYGWCDSPTAIVMANMPGQPYLGGAESDPRLLKLVEDYLTILADVHRINLSEFDGIGLQSHDSETDNTLAYLHMAEKTYFANKTAPNPLIEFVRLWLRRNIPAGRNRRCFLVGDAPQFLYQDDAITCIYDLEMARVGDPMFDLASLRVRDTNEPTGHLGQLFNHYAQQAGEPLNIEAINFYSVLQFIAVPMIAGPSLSTVKPHPGFVEYLSWCYSGFRSALEAMAELMDITLDPAPLLSVKTSRHHDALQDLVAQCQALPDPGGFMRQHPALSLANYAYRADQLSEAIDALEMDGMAELLGTRPASLAKGEEELEKLIINADSSLDEALLRFFHRRALAHLQLIQDYPSSVVTRGLGPIK